MVLFEKDRANSQPVKVESSTGTNDTGEAAVAAAAAANNAPKGPIATKDDTDDADSHAQAAEEFTARFKLFTPTGDTSGLSLPNFEELEPSFTQEDFQTSRSPS